MGIHHSTAWGYINGYNKPSADHIRALAKLFDEQFMWMSGCLRERADSIVPSNGGVARKLADHLVERSRGVDL